MDGSGGTAGGRAGLSVSRRSQRAESAVTRGADARGVGVECERARTAIRVPWRDLDLGAVRGAKAGAADVDKALVLEAGDRGKGGGDIRDGCAFGPRGEREGQLSIGTMLYRTMRMLQFTNIAASGYKLGEGPAVTAGHGKRRLLWTHQWRSQAAAEAV